MGVLLPQETTNQCIFTQAFWTSTLSYCLGSFHQFTQCSNGIKLCVRCLIINKSITEDTHRPTQNYIQHRAIQLHFTRTVLKCIKLSKFSLVVTCASYMWTQLLPPTSKSYSYGPDRWLKWSSQIPTHLSESLWVLHFKHGISFWTKRGVVRPNDMHHYGGRLQNN